MFGAAKVSHFEILCCVYGFQPSVNCFRVFYTSSYTKGWMLFVKRSEMTQVCHSKPLDSVKNWNNHFFLVDSTIFPLFVSLKSKILSKDPLPKLSQYDMEACEFLRTHTSLFWKFPEPFLCWVGISRYYTLDENNYPTFWDGSEEIDLFAFIHHSDPTKVRVKERNLAEREVKLLKMTEGHTVPLNPLVTAASRNNGDNIDKIFYKGDDANQEHLVEKDDDVLEEVVDEKAKKSQKRRATRGVSGSDYPPKKLRDDYQPLPLPTRGKSLSTLRKMIPKGFAIPSDAMGSVDTTFVTPASDVGPMDSLSGLNLPTRPPYERYVISSGSSHHLDSYSKAASLVKSVTDVSVMTVAVATTTDANIATGSKAKDVPKDFDHIRYSASTGGIETDGASISKLKKPSISLDSFYASQSLNTETLHRVYLRTMDYDHLYFEFNVGAARQVCLGAEVRIRAEHTLEKKNELEDKYAAKGDELRDLKEKDFALEGEKNVLSERVEALESAAASKELNSKVASLEFERDCLVTQRNSLESAFEFFKEQVEKKQDKQVGVLGDRVAAIYSDLMKMALHMDAEFYPRYLTVIAGRRWLFSRGLKLVLSKCLSSPEYLSAMGEAIGRAIDKGVSFSLLAQLETHKYASMADIMDLLRSKSPAVETFEACPPQPSLDELMIPIHRLKDQVIIGETSLAFSLEVVHNRIQRLRGDAAARCLSLTDSIMPLVEPLSARNLMGEASSSADPPMIVTTALSTTFVQTCPVPMTPSTEVPSSLKVVFEEEELETTPEHVSTS
ncbi:hypothetical protein Tco_0531907 [Tanacetum coccineum]